MRTNAAKKVADAPKNKGGRPPKQIDLNQVKQLAGLQCTDEEMCAVLGISQDTLARRKADPEFAETIAQGKAMGKLSLRRAHFKLAQTNPAVHIFACKNLLGMSDKIEQVIEQSAKFVVELPAESEPQDWQSTFRPVNPGTDDDNTSS